MNWGARIAILYISFAALIITLVTMSMRHRVDLVTDNYYGEEIAYQKVIDAGKNQSALSVPATISSTAENITITFPAEFREAAISGTVQFYCAQRSDYDRKFPLNTTANIFTIPYNSLKPARYTVKISWTADGKSYYQETDFNHPAL